ncbi:MAG: DUF4260 domain-containing protein [Chloroflexia bacterium]|nr:DUF4260 domain-containing protein [Chloroflexia bacterium]MDQ3411018.1 DUF4260 domain-containing protein [Chloroflexota bacterium]
MIRWLRAESAAVFVAALLLYWQTGGPWWLLLLLILAPDLSALGYLAGPGIGSRTYNLAHTYVGPILLYAVAIAAGWPLATQLALIWLAHIGIDRALAYGLKYPSGFKHTHLSPPAAAQPTTYNAAADGGTRRT